jgi:hypothetical protein
MAYAPEEGFHPSISDSSAAAMLLQAWAESRCSETLPPEALLHKIYRVLNITTGTPR